MTVIITPSLSAPPALAQVMPDCTVSCQAKLQLAPAVDGTLDYRIQEADGTLLGHWTISVGLSSPTASVTYQAAPSA